MSKHFLFLLAAFCSELTITSQENNVPKWSHSLAGGIAFIANVNQDEGHDYSNIKYERPGYFAFYRLSRNHAKHSTNFTFNTCYRRASGNYATGGMGGSNTTTAQLQWLRSDIGISEFFELDKKGLGFGIGAYAGELVMKQGTVMHDDFGAFGESTSKGKASEALNASYVGLNIELRQKINISATNAIAIGLRAGLETAEGFNASKPTRQFNIYAAYIFKARKKPVNGSDQK